MASPSSPVSAGSGRSPLGSQLNVVFVIAWLICAVFYFIQYGLRSAPGIMIPELSSALGADKATITQVVSVYFYSYALFALISGVALDRIGPRFVAPTGILLLAVGSVLFAAGYMSTAYLGRLLQGAGSGVAFTSAVFLATRGFPKEWLATAVGTTQCFGMLGGFMGQAVVAPVIHGQFLTWQQFWFIAAGILVVMSMASLAVTPRTREGKVNWAGMAEPYRIVLSNPQSYLCGLVAGLMFMPTNIADIAWGTQFLESIGADPSTTATRVAMVPLGWVIGCPLLGYLADYFGRRKPVVFGSIVVMLLSGAALVYLPAGSTPPYIMGLIFGIASGAAMIPYSIIKEVNPNNVAGTATGVINFIVFFLSAIMGNVMAGLITSLRGSGDLTVEVFRSADLVYVGGLILAFILMFFVKETGTRKTPVVPVAQTAAD